MVECSKAQSLEIFCFPSTLTTLMISFNLRALNTISILITYYILITISPCSKLYVQLPIQDLHLDV
jgi:hypothetical protein